MDSNSDLIEITRWMGGNTSEQHLTGINVNQFSSVQLLHHIGLFVTPWTATHRPPCPSPTPGVYSNSCPFGWWCNPTISSSVILFFSCPQSFQHHGLFKWISSSHQVAKVLEFQLQHQSFQWTFRTDFP